MALDLPVAVGEREARPKGILRVPQAVCNPCPIVATVATALGGLLDPGIAALTVPLPQQRREVAKSCVRPFVA